MNLSILDWNIQGKRYFTVTKPEKVFPVIKNLNPDIVCLQETPKLERHLLSFALDKNYEAIQDQSESAILSKFPIIKSGELVFPKLSYLKLKNALWADIKINASTLRIYNCHLGIVGVGPQQRSQQLKFIFEHAINHSGPIIVCGDFNTTIPAVGIKRKITQLFHFELNSDILVDGKYFATDERYALADFISKNGFKEALDLDKSTWCVNLFGKHFEIYKLKLDWFLYKNLTINDLKLGEYISDHRYVLVNCDIN